jgi:hypothetical protein
MQRRNFQNDPVAGIVRFHGTPCLSRHNQERKVPFAERHKGFQRFPGEQQVKLLLVNFEANRAPGQSQIHPVASTHSSGVLALIKQARCPSGIFCAGIRIVRKSALTDLSSGEISLKGRNVGSGQP